MSKRIPVPAIAYTMATSRPRAVHSRDVIGQRHVVVGAGRDMVGLRDIVGLRRIVGRAQQVLDQIDAGVVRTTAVQSGQVVERDAEDLKRKILPIPLTVVTTLQTVRITIAPQELFKAKRLVVDPNIADDFRISNAKVATRDQFSGPGAVPAAIFGPNAFDVNIDWDSADVGEQIVLDVTNTSGGTLTFGGAFLGSSVY